MIENKSKVTCFKRTEISPVASLDFGSKMRRSESLGKQQQKFLLMR